MAVLHVVCVIWLGKRGEEGKIGKGAEREGEDAVGTVVYVLRRLSAHTVHTKEAIALEMQLSRA